MRGICLPEEEFKVEMKKKKEAVCTFPNMSLKNIQLDYTVLHFCFLDVLDINSMSLL